MNPLWALTLSLPVLAALLALELWWRHRSRSRRPATASEWMARMAVLNAKVPIKPPKFRNREMRTGFDITKPKAGTVESIENRKAGR